MQTSHNVMITERAKEVATKFILCKDATVRSVAKEMGLSRSTVHKDLTERIEREYPLLHNEARKKLNINREERHIRGVEATRQKYLAKGKNKSR